MTQLRTPRTKRTSAIHQKVELRSPSETQIGARFADVGQSRPLDSSCQHTNVAYNFPSARDYKCEHIAAVHRSCSEVECVSDLGKKR